MDSQLGGTPELSDVLRDDVRACPFCNRDMVSNISLCSACHKFSKPIQRRAPQHEVVSRGYKGWGVDANLASALTSAFFPLAVPSGIQKLIATVCFGLALLNGLVWLTHGGMWLLLAAIEASIVGAAIFGKNLLFAPQNQEDPIFRNGLPHNHSRGHHFSIAAVQVAGLAIMTASALAMNQTTSILLAWIVIGMAVPVYRAGWKTSALVSAAAAAGFLLLSSSEFIWFTIQMNILSSSLAIPIIWFERYIWVLGILAVLPPTRLLQVGRFYPGGIAGDQRIGAFDVTVPLALTSGALLMCAWGTLISVLNAPGLVSALI